MVAYENTCQLLQASDAQPASPAGLWLGLADPYCAEILAGTGFDWLLIDGEHAPNDLRSVLGQLQAIASASSALPGPGSHPVVRLPLGETALIKQYLELGAQTILVPMVDTAEHAAQLAQAMRYPPQGIRGMGSPLGRSSRWQLYPDYIHEANEQVCLLVQAAMEDGIHRILKAGKAPHSGDQRGTGPQMAGGGRLVRGRRRGHHVAHHGGGRAAGQVQARWRGRPRRWWLLTSTAKADFLPALFDAREHCTNQAGALQASHDQR